MKPEFQLIVSLATILMSGVLSAIVSNYLTKRKEYVTLKRQKLEQLYLAYRKYLVHSLRSQSYSLKWTPKAGQAAGGI